MDNSMALLGLSLLALLGPDAGASLSLNVVRTKVKHLAHIMMFRIKKLDTSPNMVIEGLDQFPHAEPADRLVKGLPSIVETIKFYQDIMLFLDEVDLIPLVEDTSTMKGLLENWMKVCCPAQKQSAEGDLKEALKDTNKRYGLTLGPAALKRLKGYLSWLLLNLDQLKIC
uniref:Leptin n=1 Tax=Esox lucius TaxID=8010 RepID=A0AAY5KBV8_ESOLU